MYEVLSSTFNDCQRFSEKVEISFVYMFSDSHVLISAAGSGTLDARTFRPIKTVDLIVTEHLY